MRAVAVWHFCHFLYSPSVLCRQVSEVLVFKLVHLRFHLKFLCLPFNLVRFALTVYAVVVVIFGRQEQLDFALLSREMRTKKKWESIWVLNVEWHETTRSNSGRTERKAHLFVFCLFNRKCKFEIHTDFSSSSLCYVVVQPPLFLLIHPISCWFTRFVVQMEEKASHKIRNVLLFHWSSKHLKFDAVLKLLKLHEKSETPSLFSQWSERVSLTWFHV